MFSDSSVCLLFYLTRDLLENWVHVYFLRCSISTSWLVVWPTSTHFSQYTGHRETRLFESGFQWRDGMRKPEGMGDGRASQVRRPLVVLGIQGIRVAVRLCQVLLSLLAECTHAFLAIPSIETTVGLCVSSAAITSILFCLLAYFSQYILLGSILCKHKKLSCWKSFLIMYFSIL